MENSHRGSLLETVEHFVIFRDERAYSSFPAVAALPSGDSLLVFRWARDVRWLLPDEPTGDLADARRHVDHLDPRSRLLAVRLDGNGRPVESPRPLPPDPEAADQDASLFVTSRGTILLTSFCWYPLPPGYAPLVTHPVGGTRHSVSSYALWGVNVRRSTDGGQTFDSPRYLPSRETFRDVIPGRMGDRGGATRGTVTELDGQLLLGTYAGSWKQWRGCSVHLYASPDDGVSWDYRGPIGWDEEGVVNLFEPSLYATPRGKLIAFARSAGLPNDQLVVLESHDNGHNFGPMRPRPIIGHPYCPMRLPDGRCLLVYGYRHDPFGVRAQVLSAEGKRLSGVTEHVVRDDGPGPDLGYPWATRLPDDRILVVYYFTDRQYVRHIAGTILRYRG